MAEESATHAMAAAVAAAAQIAEHGGMSIFDEGSSGATIVDDRDPPVHHPDCFTRNNQCQSLHDDVGGGGDEWGRVEDEEDAEKRIARCRERNREHARRTRLRKKAQLEILKTKVKGLEAESKQLKQSIEECNVASILLGISSGNTNRSANVDGSRLPVATDSAAQALSCALGGNRKHSISEDDEEKLPQPIKLTVDGHTHFLGGGKTHINWKSGVYCDENGKRKTLTQRQLDGLRRERNRMHAKMTRDRKKCFIATIEKTIDELVNENNRMRQVLTEVAKHHFGPNAITPHTSPLFVGAQSNDLNTPDIQDSMSSPAIVDSYPYFDNQQDIVGSRGVSYPISCIAPIVSD